MNNEFWNELYTLNLLVFKILVANKSLEALADSQTELPQDIAKRIRDAAEMGDVTTLNAIAEEIKDQSDSCMLLSKQIVQMAEDFDLDGIQKLADDLDSS